MLLSSAEAFNASVGTERYLHWYEAQMLVRTTKWLQTFGTITSCDALSLNVADQIFAAREDIGFFF